MYDFPVLSTLLWLLHVRNDKNLGIKYRVSVTNIKLKKIEDQNVTKLKIVAPKIGQNQKFPSLRIAKILF